MDALFFVIVTIITKQYLSETLQSFLYVYILADSVYISFKLNHKKNHLNKQKYKNKDTIILIIKP